MSRRQLLTKSKAVIPGYGNALDRYSDWLLAQRAARLGRGGFARAR